MLGRMANDETKVSASVEVHFAQRLSANEKKIRDRAMKKLRKWLEVKSITKKDQAFTENDFLKIWKGLHYCLWMQDKPLLQEEMSAFISRLMHVFVHTDTTLMFIQVFLQTEAREWHGIDRWRMDKFMMLFRNMLTQSLEFLKKHKWKEDLITKFTEILSSKIMTLTNEKAPDGLKIHLADIYLDELEKVGTSELPSDKVLQLLSPFTQYIKNSRNLVIVERVISRIFDAIIEQTVSDAMKSAEKQLEAEDSDNEDGKDDVDDLDIPPRLQFDFKALADTLFACGSSKECVSKNRNMIYALVKKFKDLDEGVLPVEKEEEETADALSKRDIAIAVQSLSNLDKKKKKKRKKRKKKSQETENEVKDIGADTHAENSETMKGKRKTESTTEGTDMSPPKKKKGNQVEERSNPAVEKDLSSKSPSHSKEDGSTDKHRHIGLDTIALKHLKERSENSNVKSPNHHKDGSTKEHRHIGLDTLALKHLKDRSEDSENLVEAVPSELENSVIKQTKGNGKKLSEKEFQNSEALDVMGDNSTESSITEGDNSNNSLRTPLKSAKKKKKTLNNSSVEIVDNSSEEKSTSLNQSHDLTLPCTPLNKRGNDVVQESVSTQKSSLTASNKKTPKGKQNHLQSIDVPESTTTPSSNKQLKGNNLEHSVQEEKSARTPANKKTPKGKLESLDESLPESITTSSNTKQLRGKRNNLDHSLQEKKSGGTPANTKTPKGKRKPETAAESIPETISTPSNSKKLKGKANSLNDDFSKEEKSAETPSNKKTPRGKRLQSIAEAVKGQSTPSNITTRKREAVPGESTPSNINTRKREAVQGQSTPSNINTRKGRKSTGDKLDSSTALDTPKSDGFAKFDKLLKTPPAFVRKSVSKLTTPKSAVKQKKIATPSSCSSDTKKKVIFNMQKNESLSFQESIQFSPEAFNPEKQPDQGILKTPSPAVTRSQSAKRRASTGAVKRSKASDFF